LDVLEKCPKCGDTNIHNIFLNAERTKGIHRCYVGKRPGDTRPVCGFEERHEPPPLAPPPLPYRQQQ
jgi:hypothetical protein